MKLLKDYKFLIKLGYVLMGIWTLAACIYIGSEMAEQHAIFGELSSIEHAAEGWQKDADTLTERGKIGILYCLQELQQDPEQSDFYETARALEKAAGRFRAPISESDKNALRKLISDARFAMANAIDTQAGFSPRMQAILRQGTEVLKRYQQVELFRHLDKQRAIDVLASLAANQQVDTEAALYIRNQYELLLERLDRAIAGETFPLYPEEQKLVKMVIDYCESAVLEDDDLQQLHDALAGIEKIAGQSFGILDEQEAYALKRVAVEFPDFEEDIEPDTVIEVPAELKATLQNKAAEYQAALAELPEYSWDYHLLSAAVSGLQKLTGNYAADVSAEEKRQMLALTDNEDVKKDIVPAALITRWAEGKQLEYTADERETAIDAIVALRRTYDERRTDVFKKADKRFLQGSLKGLYAMLGKGIASLTKGESNALDTLLKDKEFEQKLPVEKLKAWYLNNPVYFDRAERAQLLAVSDEFFAKYEGSRKRMAEVTYRFMKKMKQDENRFRRYPVTEDQELQKEASTFKIISALWFKTEERVMMIDLIDICGTPNKEVRSYMEKALITIGEPAVPNLLRAIKREKIDQALAAPTAYRTKLERLRELNDSNEWKRLSCLKVLAEIGDEESKDVIVPLVDDKDPDIAEAAAKALKKL